MQANKPRFYTTSKPPAFISGKFKLDASKIGLHTVYTIQPKYRPGHKHILYIHGGAFVQGFVLPHWNFFSNLINATGCTILAPDYPLAPAHTYRDVLNMVLTLYKQLIVTVSPGNLILMGDSAGGGFILALAQHLHKEGITQPSKLILLSPWLDLTLSNPEIKHIDPIDPFLGIEGLLMAGKAYAGDTPSNHYLLSPIYGSLAGLNNIAVFVGTKEIMVADARKLKSQADQLGIKLEYHEYPEMIHTWMLLHLPESKQARKQIFDLVNQV